MCVCVCVCVSVCVSVCVFTIWGINATFCTFSFIHTCTLNTVVQYVCHFVLLFYLRNGTYSASLQTNQEYHFSTFKLSNKDEWTQCSTQKTPKWQFDKTYYHKTTSLKGGERVGSEVPKTYAFPL